VIPEEMKVEVTTNIAFNSKYEMEDIDYCDFIPDDPEARKKYKYYCPICLRYFNTILTSDCCKNYLCHLCLNDL